MHIISSLIYPTVHAATHDKIH